MKNKVWVIDDDQSIRWVLERALSKADFEVTTFDMAETAMQALAVSTPNVIVTDIRMPGIDGLDFLKKVQTQNSELPIIVMTAHSDLDNAVTAYQNGAFEYLPKPFDVNEAVELARRACIDDSDSMPGETVIQEMPEIIGESQAMQDVFRAIGRLSLSSITVLING